MKFALRPDQVRYLGSIANLKATYCLLGYPIGTGHAPMQAQKCSSQESVRKVSMKRPSSAGSLEYAPVVSSVATAFARVLTERLEKRAPVLWINTRYSTVTKTGPLIGFDGMSGDRVGPLAWTARNQHSRLSVISSAT